MGFFYLPAKKLTDIVVSSFIPNWIAPSAPARLEVIRKWLNVMVAHLTTHRTDPAYKIGEITESDVRLIREHTKTLFKAFVNPRSEEQRKMLVNPLAHKFTRYETLKP